jgi:hypothetical protein
LDRVRERFGWHRGAVLAATLGAVTLAYQPALRARLFQLPSPGIDPEYASTQPLYLRLAKECASNPGIVLANMSDGNPILFHTDCSVITNTFIVSRADDEHLRRAGRLFNTPPAGIRQAEPGVRYLLLRTRDFAPEVGGEQRLRTDNPLVAELLLASDLPAGFTALQTAWRGTGTGGIDDVYARLYKIAPADAASGH